MAFLKEVVPAAMPFDIFTRPWKRAI